MLRQLFAEAASLLPDADLPIVGRIYEPPQTKVRTLSEDEQYRLALTAEFLYGFKWQLFLTVLLDQAFPWRDENDISSELTLSVRRIAGRGQVTPKGAARSEATVGRRSR